MSEHARECEYFVAFEPNPGRPGWHAHALLYGLVRLRSELWQRWFSEFGRNRIEPIASKGDVVTYCAKYVTKLPNTWWDLRLKKPDAKNRRPSERFISTPTDVSR
jgi:hypothetical protein